MPVILNADNGAVSGISGLTTSADNSGVLQFQSSGTATLEISTAGNITIPGTGKRILGDFSNTTTANRVLFQSSTANGLTAVSAIPNGTGTFAGYIVHNSASDIANASSFGHQITSAEAQLSSSRGGTGTFLPMTFYTGGSERLRIDTSGNVGIGTSSPESGFRLHVAGNGFFSPASGTIGKVVVDNVDQRLVLGSYFQAGVGQYSFISSTNNAETGNLDLYFRTGTTDRMVITSTGNVAIGTSLAFGRLTVDATGFSPLLTALTIGDLTTATNAVGIYLRSSGTSPAFITTAGAPLAFSANSTGSPELMRISPGGALVLSGGNTSATGTGITFPASQNASSDPNTLDDYEEGTWTPTWTSGVTSPVYSDSGGTYTKIGRLVTITLRLQTVGGSATSGQLVIGGLPFLYDGNTRQGGCIINYQAGLLLSNELTLHIGGISPTTIQFYSTNGTPLQGNQVNNVLVTLHINGFYYTT